MPNDERLKHVVDCEGALGCWSSRREEDVRGYVVPRQNIQVVLARQNALFDCLQYIEGEFNVNFADFKVLDVGSASGYGLTPLLIAGFSMDQLHGIDLFPERVNLGKNKYPGLNLNVGDATEMAIFEDKQFDMTMEQFCFCHVEDDAVVAKMAKQMLRVTKPGGYILVMDWMIGSKTRRYNGISKSKIQSIFSCGVETEMIKRFPAQLAPPLGRFLSRHLPSLYPLVSALFPFLVLSHLTLLRRKGGPAVPQ